MGNFGSWFDEYGAAAVIGIGALLVVTLIEVWRTWRFVHGSVRTTGAVVAYQTRQEAVNGEDADYVRDVYAQIIRYTDEAGATRTFSGPTTGSRKRQTIGTSIQIRYHPWHDVPPRVDSITSIYGRPMTLLMIITVITFLTLNGS